jgi:hypothetical protein
VPTHVPVSRNAISVGDELSQLDLIKSANSNRVTFHCANDEINTPENTLKIRYPFMYAISPDIYLEALKSVDLEWGSEEQVLAQNKTFEFCFEQGVFTQDDAELVCLKATTAEMMDWIETQCVAFLMCPEYVS